MKAAIFDEPGLANLKVRDNIKKPETNDHDVLIRVKVAGVNPIDNFVVSGSLPKLIPLPNHIPGAEISGIVEDIGSHVNIDGIKKGNRVVVHNKVFDGTCDMCLNGLDMLCRNGGLIGAITNGGFAEYISVPERNVFKIPDNLDWELAASLPVTSLTPYHALKEASLKINEYVLVFGASGNTGMIAVQIGKKMGAKVIAVSRDNWIKNEFGANYVISDYDKVAEQVKEITQGKMAVQSLYSRQIKLIGSTGGTRKEMQELVDISPELKVRVWKKFDLENVKEALQALFAKERDGRILLNIS